MSTSRRRKNGRQKQKQWNRILRITNSGIYRAEIMRSNKLELGVRSDATMVADSITVAISGDRME